MANSPVNLPGFHTPAVGFDQPFEMLEACHERVQRSLGLLQRIVDHVDAHGHDAQSRSAVADVLRYFDLAGPHHHEDEERHVFPRVQAHPDARVRQAVAQLQADHIRMHSDWARLRQILGTWQDEHADPAIVDDDRVLVRDFVATYERHIPLEESVVYPAAQGQFSPDELARVGEEMARRRQG